MPSSRSYATEEDALVVSSVTVEGSDRVIPFVAHGGTAGCLCFDQQSGQVLLVVQYRPVVGAELAEVPSGRIHHGESPEDAAIRETLEETGYLPEGLVSLGTYFSSVGLTNEAIHLYMSSSWSKPSGGQHLVELNAVWVGLDDALHRAYSDETSDAKTTLALLRLAALIEPTNDNG